MFRSFYRTFAFVKYAIIAAGEGSRLHADGVNVPKPLVRVGGECLVDRLVRIFLSQDASEIAIVCNNLHPETAAHLRQLKAAGTPLDIVVKTTPSSLHSLVALSPYVESDFVCATTVDTLFQESEFGGYIEAVKKAVANGWDGVMGVTTYVDDEKPLYVSVDDEQCITAFSDVEEPDSRYVSAGIYGLSPRCMMIARRCVTSGVSRMRNFQRMLLSSGLRLQAYPLSHVIDIDHASDIAKAERWLTGEGLTDNKPGGKSSSAAKQENES